MKFALHYEIQINPETPDYEYRAVHEALEQMEFADEMGFDRIWLVEHHFLNDLSVSACPDLFFSALSQRTKNIRLGLGVVILPYHHPVQVAERVAMLDIISDGRVDFGVGRGGPYEQVGFGADPRETRAMVDESLRMICDMWKTEGEFSHEGKFWQVPPRIVLPTPYQKPHPPIWMACTQPETFKVATELGLAVLSLSIDVPAALDEAIKGYRDEVSQVNPVGGYIHNQWSNLAWSYCGEDNREARELCTKATRRFFGPGRPYAAAAAKLAKDLLQHWGGEIPDHLRNSRNFNRLIQSSDSLAAGQGEALESFWEALDADTLCDSGALVAGDPESCINGMRQHEKVGADEVILSMQNATIPHEKVMKSLELFGKHVIPAFRTETAPVH